MNVNLSLEEVLFEPLVAVFGCPLVQNSSRSCTVFKDEAFLKSGIGRVLEVVQSGREWVQHLQQHDGLVISSSDYFAALESSRRLGYVVAVREALETLELANLRAKNDRLASIPELKDFDVWAADGHVIEHACHDLRRKSKDGTESYVGVNQIFAIDLRTGWVRPVALCEGKEHEIKALKRQPDGTLKMKASGGTIIIYDSAILDVIWLCNLHANNGIAAITRSKENLRPIHEVPIPWDRTDKRNRGVIADEIVGFNNLGQLRRVRYRDPETAEIYEFLTTEMTLPPGVIALLHRMRWGIEKSFDEFENKLSEKKAWATTRNAKLIQCNFTAISYNLLLLLEQRLSTDHQLQDIKVEEKYDRWITLREAVAEVAGRSLKTHLSRACAAPRSIPFSFSAGCEITSP
jgi:Transposase DDE domain